MYLCRPPSTVALVVEVLWVTQTCSHQLVAVVEVVEATGVAGQMTTVTTMHTAAPPATLQ